MPGGGGGAAAELAAVGGSFRRRVATHQRLQHPGAAAQPAQLALHVPRHSGVGAVIAQARQHLVAAQHRVHEPPAHPGYRKQFEQRQQVYQRKARSALPSPRGRSGSLGGGGGGPKALSPEQHAFARQIMAVLDKVDGQGVTRAQLPPTPPTSPNSAPCCGVLSPSRAAGSIVAGVLPGGRAAGRRG